MAASSGAHPGGIFSIYRDDEILQQAKACNRGLDPDGYVSRLDIMPLTARRAGARLESL